MLNQRKLYVSLITSVLLIAVVTIVAADDAVLNQETQAQNPGEIAVCIDETNLQEEMPLSDVAACGLEDEEEEVTTEEEKTSSEEESLVPSDAIPENVSWVEPETQEINDSQLEAVTSTSIWMEAYEDLMYGEATPEKLAVRALIETKRQERAMMNAPTDHIVNYHGTKYAISEEEYQVLLRIVESEAPCEDIEGRMLVANVVLNRVHAKQFPDSISEVVFQKGQFAPISDGSYYRRTVSAKTVEAVERVLVGEDNSRGALYFVARGLASKEGLKFFDEKLEKLFKHGVHTFYAEK